MVEAIKQNFPQREIADASFRYQQEVDSKQRIVVGVNDYVDENEEAIPILRINPELERKQKGRVEATKTRRDSAAVERTLGELRAAAATDANLMAPILDCARARVSEGEMVEALQQVFGSYTELPVF
jgi:methylmalonyl-CoA mutase N-terminal domain/subunit